MSWNTRDLLDRCIASFAGDAAAGRVEVWVVDNGSTDRSVDVARRHPFARVIALEENLGYARALGLVLEETRCPWIVCANADTAVTPGALQRLLAAAADRPDVGIVAPRLILPDGSTQYSVHFFPTARRLALYHSGLARLNPALGERLTFGAYWDPGRSRHVDWAYGALLLVRREALEEVGGFGSATRLYAEDLDLAWRLRRAGWRTWYEAGATVHHAESAATTKAWGAERHLRRATAGYAWLAWRRGRARALAAGAVTVTGALVRALTSPGQRERWRDEARLQAAALRRGLAGPDL